MWGIFVVLYKEDGGGPEQCLWKSQSSQGREKTLPLRFTSAGRELEKEVSALRWATSQRELVTSVLREAQGNYPSCDRRWNKKVAALGLSSLRALPPLSSQQLPPLGCAGGRWALVWVCRHPSWIFSLTQGAVLRWAGSVRALASQPQGWTPLEFAKYLDEQGGRDLFLLWK